MSRALRNLRAWSLRVDERFHRALDRVPGWVVACVLAAAVIDTLLQGSRSFDPVMAVGLLIAGLACAIVLFAALRSMDRRRNRTDPPSDKA